jgi:hypothetical protein
MEITNTCMALLLYLKAILLIPEFFCQILYFCIFCVLSISVNHTKGIVLYMGLAALHCIPQLVKNHALHRKYLSFQLRLAERKIFYRALHIGTSEYKTINSSGYEQPCLQLVCAIFGWWPFCSCGGKDFFLFSFRFGRVVWVVQGVAFMFRQGGVVFIDLN